MSINETIDLDTRGRTAGRVAATLWDLGQTIALALAIFLGIRLVAQNFKVEGTSMEPTLHHGQFLVIVKAAYLRVDGTPFERLLATPNQASRPPQFLFGGPSRGDIVVFRSPTPGERDFIKRIVGVPGDMVEIREARVHLNGSPLEEPYIRGPANYQVGAQVVPAGHYFVLGDNRANSSDSHVWGFLPVNNLIGKAWLTYWPPPYWGLVPSVSLAARPT